MSQDVIEFVTQWVRENINAEVYDPDQKVIDAHVARLVADAGAASITQAQLEEELGDLSDFIMDEIDAAADDEAFGMVDEDD